MTMRIGLAGQACANTGVDRPPAIVTRLEIKTPTTNPTNRFITSLNLDAVFFESYTRWAGTLLMIYVDTSALVPVFIREAKSEPTGRPGTAVLSTKQCDGDVAEKQPGRGRQLPLSMGPVQTLDTPPIVTVMLSRSTKPVPWSVPSSKTIARPVSVPANMSNSDALRPALAAPRVRMAGDPYESSSHLVGSPGEG